ncbi:alkali metal cation/H+ antiporter Nha1 C terminus-domain-containing protein [Lasiosphaeria miniovina]|uniref:Alkali metal cation/H+ antiporter Nha1 C terminus-domain-containing protein n=1 Tax=Lasiosphaeria miniovina TaxID=1954250 RepID=A0AA40AV81_9PEZI|nr:alkali metal cation/H+ antiporter Nha1 C terminus-domain-containing protein [Lasiosphaeria miniovina]KAK0722589.1 alkali metal cation/H+ antiporter Nha1 C terminus-domain-containing protein [Lasiosphaeria miniovina]
MAWEHLSITKPHLVYIILGGFTSLFMLCSSVIKERMYIGEATVATLCGVIFGPHAADLINPLSWGSVDIVTIEFSRIVLVVQCFAVGVELPKFYMEKHWRSVFFLLVPVMTFGWLITSLFIWWLIEPLSWLESLVVAACVTATDPVLASSVVGKGKFAKRVPKHLRDLLSAESGCNDGMAFPFIYLSLYLIQDHQKADKVSFHWIVYTILYECVFGAVFGFLVGYFARHGIKFAEKRELIDRESFLVFYFVLALFCAGAGSILGVDDLLVGFACGVGFSNDGWFTNKTEESHVSNVIDLLLNLTYFVYFGTIIPWEQFNDAAFGLSAWRLAVLAIFVIFFRRIPIMMALKPIIPDIKTWREALFAGHFGPIGVGAIFVAILARAELEHESAVPLSELPSPDSEHFTLLSLVWPITTFLVVASIIVHGSSIAVFTLGKRINTLTITMSYTQAGEEGPTWMNRLPRISSQSRSQARTTDTEGEELKLPEMPPGTLPPIGIPGHFLRRVQEDDNSTTKQGSRASSLSGRRRRKKWDDGIGPGGPITQSAIFPQRRSQSEQVGPTSQGDVAGQPQYEGQDPAMLSPTDAARASRLTDQRHSTEIPPRQEASPEGAASPQDAGGEMQVYEEGNNIIIENQDGDVLAVERSGGGGDHMPHPEKLKSKLQEGAENLPSGWSYEAIKKKFINWREEEVEKRKEKEKMSRSSEPARAYKFGTTIIVENEDGEVIKKYELPTPQRGEGDFVSQGLKYMGMGGLVKGGDKQGAVGSPADDGGKAGPSKTSVPGWASGAFGRSPAGESSTPKGTPKGRKKSVVEEEEEEDDRHIRFTIGGVGQRMTKEDFIQKMQKLDTSTRWEIVDQSNASHTIKTLAKQDPVPSQPRPSPAQGSHRGKETASPSGSDAQRGRKMGDTPRQDSATTSRSPSRSLSRSPSPVAMGTTSSDAPSRDAPETAVERRRRLAVLKGVGEPGDVQGETAAERRRREAALGVSSSAVAGEDSDSDDDDTPRVPPPKRGIRFADAPAKGRE